jgi:hypothetical protein
MIVIAAVAVVPLLSDKAASGIGMKCARVGGTGIILRALSMHRQRWFMLRRHLRRASI